MSPSGIAGTLIATRLFAPNVMHPTPSPLKIITRDYASMALLFLSLAVSTFGIEGGVMALMGAIALIGRMTFIRAVFRRGVPVEAFLVQTCQCWSIWRIDYRYSYGGTLYAASNRVIGVQLGLRRGNCAVVFLNPDHPHQAFIAHLFLNDTARHWRHLKPVEPNSLTKHVKLLNGIKF